MQLALLCEDVPFLCALRKITIAKRIVQDPGQRVQHEHHHYSSTRNLMVRAKGDQHGVKEAEIAQCVIRGSVGSKAEEWNEKAQQAYGQEKRAPLLDEVSHDVPPTHQERNAL